MAQPWGFFIAQAVPILSINFQQRRLKLVMVKFMRLNDTTTFINHSDFEIFHRVTQLFHSYKQKIFVCVLLLKNSTFRVNFMLF